MKRNTPLLVLLLTEGLLAGLCFLFYLVVRPQLMDSYQQSALQLNTSAQLALATPLLPGTAGLAFTASLVIAGSQLQRSQRLRLIGIAAAVTGFAFIAAALLSFLPLLG